jgi:predicted AlkP superfamily pyrophosphatase or phosphodiesterase
VVTLSLKARSAIGLAGHGGTAVTWVDDGAAHFVTSRAYGADLVGPMYEFLRRDPFDADAKKMWTLRDDPATYRYRDATVGARPQQSRTGLFPHRIGGAKGTEAPFFTLWQASPYSDAYLERMAEAMIDAFALGQRDTTDFLGVSLSALDLVGHAYGPESREIEDHLRRLDDTIGALMATLDRKVGRDNWVLGFSSDHGVAPIAVTTGGGRVATDDIRDRIEETLITRYGRRNEKEGNYVSSVTFNYVYLAPGIFDRIRADAPTYDEIERGLLEVPGMDRVLRADRLSDTSSDRVVRAAALSHVPARSGDLILVSKPNWYFGPRGDAAGTTHGTAHPYDRRVPVILLGRGIKAGRLTQAATPADIAPTMAQVMGVKLPKAEGRVLREALK